LASCASVALAGEERVVLELTSPMAISAGATTVSFKLLDMKTNQELTPAELQVSHEKLLHFIAYDPGLKSSNTFIQSSMEMCGTWP
jgi:hypothetical protein